MPAISCRNFMELMILIACLLIGVITTRLLIYQRYQMLLAFLLCIVYLFPMVYFCYIMKCGNCMLLYPFFWLVLNEWITNSFCCFSYAELSLSLNDFCYFFYAPSMHLSRHSVDNLTHLCLSCICLLFLTPFFLFHIFATVFAERSCYIWNECPRVYSW